MQGVGFGPTDLGIRTAAFMSPSRLDLESSAVSKLGYPCLVVLFYFITIMRNNYKIFITLKLCEN